LLYIPAFSRGVNRLTDAVTRPLKALAARRG